jgi:hypothetical protein
MAEQQLPHMEYQDAIKLIKEQCRVRPIVPFLGAGISSASGFPTIGAIVEYLSKVDFTIQNKVYGHRYPQLSEKKSPKSIENIPADSFVTLDGPNSDSSMPIFGIGWIGSSTRTRRNSMDRDMLHPIFCPIFPRQNLLICFLATSARASTPATQKRARRLSPSI